MIDGMIARFQNHLWFWRKVDMRANDECWLWLPSKDRAGYGSVRIPKKLYYFKSAQVASRVAYYISHFSDPFPLMEADRAGERAWDVHHDCENTICCNPFHLRLIPHSENVALGFKKALHRKRSYTNFILAYSHHLPKEVNEHEISSDEHWDWRNNI